MTNRAIVAAYRRAMQKNPVQVRVTRITGVAPNTSLFSVEVTAVVRDYLPDTTIVAQTGYSSAKPGAITQGDRMVILLADDLQALQFPLPVKKHDKIVLLATNDVLDVVDVDANKRAIAGAIEIKAVGVS